MGLNNNVLFWQQMKSRADVQLASLFDTLHIPSSRLKAAMKYAVLSQGKRLRPILIYLTGKALNIPLEKLDPSVRAVECMHAYSLIHDDLPAMDNDDWRRGQLTCHRAFDEASAILAGDALQALAFQQILLAEPHLLTLVQKTEILTLLSEACGAQGMVSGQALDLEYLHQEIISLELLQKIHQLKTGVLIEACINLAIITSKGADQEKQKSLLGFAKSLGLAFQIQDDYLDAYGETEILGKQQGADKRQGKLTYVNLYSREDLFKLIEKSYQDALSFLQPFAKDAEDLIAFTQFLSQRNS